MVRKAQIRVSINSGPLVEERVRSAMTRGGATVERVEQRPGTAGGKEYLFRVLLGERRSLEEIVRAIEGVKGAAVTGATLLGSEASLKITEGWGRG